MYLTSSAVTSVGVMMRVANSSSRDTLMERTPVLGPMLPSMFFTQELQVMPIMISRDYYFYTTSVPSIFSFPFCYLPFFNTTISTTSSVPSTSPFPFCYLAFFITIPTCPFITFLLLFPCLTLYQFFLTVSFLI